MHVQAGRWPIDQAAGFLILPIGDMILFAGLFGAAVKYQNKPDIHKRLMIAATVALAFAAVARMSDRMALALPIFFLLWLLAGYGIEEPARDRVIAACYGALDLITFFTTANQEAHAWQVHRGAKAFEAAGVIHSDMERGFIRAEVVPYDELVEAGSWEEARARGYMRIEGREHRVNEGDVLHIRFAV